MMSSTADGGPIELALGARARGSTKGALETACERFSAVLIGEPDDALRILSLGRVVLADLLARSRCDVLAVVTQATRVRAWLRIVEAAVRVLRPEREFAVFFFADRDAARLFLEGRKERASVAAGAPLLPFGAPSTPAGRRFTRDALRWAVSTSLCADPAGERRVAMAEPGSLATFLYPEALDDAQLVFAKLFAWTAALQTSVERALRGRRSDVRALHHAIGTFVAALEDGPSRNDASLDGASAGLRSLHAICDELRALGGEAWFARFRRSLLRYLEQGLLAEVALPAGRVPSLSWYVDTRMNASFLHVALDLVVPAHRLDLDLGSDDFLVKELRRLAVFGVVVGRDLVPGEVHRTAGITRVLMVHHGVDRAAAAAAARTAHRELEEELAFALAQLDDKTSALARYAHALDRVVQATAPRRTDVRAEADRLSEPRL